MDYHHPWSAMTDGGLLQEQVSFFICIALLSVSNTVSSSNLFLRTFSLSQSVLFGNSLVTDLVDFCPSIYILGQTSITLITDFTFTFDINSI